MVMSIERIERGRAGTSRDFVPLEQPDEAARRDRLRRNKRAATGLLALMAGLLAVSHTVDDPGFWTGLLRAGAEAGVVGGLADWFAVTALFRHPLGLPIPHTGIVAAQKERIGRGMGGFVERHFLAPMLLAARLRAIDPAARIASWLSVEDNARLVAGRLTASLPVVLRSVEDRGLREFIGLALGEQLQQFALAPILGRGLRVLTSSGEYDALFDRTLDAASTMISNNAVRVEAIVARHSRWWVPKAIDRKITRAILDGLQELVDELRSPVGHGRREFRAATDQLIDDLMHGEDYRARLEAAKTRLLAHPEVQAWLHSVWDQIRDAVLHDLARDGDSSKTRATVTRALAASGHALGGDAAIRARLNDAIETAVIEATTALRTQIGGYISDVVNGWDSRTIADRLELAIGTDLQYVRINGTLVGGSVGCLLYLIAWALG
jgi:uncharacterized membrane-anchored protein YjiN (DUF445 family)